MGMVRICSVEIIRSQVLTLARGMDAVHRSDVGGSFVCVAPSKHTVRPKV